ncbi:MAG: DUF2157 domain-containing protein [Chitinophagaceae bacterium]|nr:MAG: DUF2157 domain-containing protein [Chitinophagaceae bacterium]
MAKIERDDIYLISRNSDLTKSEITALMQKHVYSDAASWKKFLRIFFMSLGVGFLLAGVIMFFAYNWDLLGKFSKLGLIELLIVITVALVLFTNLKQDIKNIALTAASVLTGVLFAVFGQIYQTGANAYDFFLGWTLSITLWVIAGRFAPLYLIYLILINVTIVLYSEQVAGNWSTEFVYTLIFTVNLTALAIFQILKESGSMKMPSWFVKVLALATVACATTGITAGIFGNPGPAFSVLVFLTIISYATGIWYSLKKKRAFYLSIIPFSLVIIISDLLLNLGSDASMFFITFLFVIISVTFIIRNLVSLQKKWAIE